MGVSAISRAFDDEVNFNELKFKRAKLEVSKANLAFYQAMLQSAVGDSPIAYNKLGEPTPAFPHQFLDVKG